MSKKFKFLKKLSLIFVISLLVSSCGSADDAVSTALDSPKSNADFYAGPIGESEKNLNILVWPGYAEDGATDSDIDWVTPFEKFTGCDVTVRTFNTAEEGIQLMQEGGYDVISASSDFSFNFIETKIVQAINTDLLENYADIYQDLKYKPWNVVDEQTFGIVNGRGAELLTSNIAKVQNNSNTWASIFDPNSEYKGKIGVHDSPMSIAIAALYLMNTNPSLEIKNPYALDQNQFDAVMQLIMQQKSMVSNYWFDYPSNLENFKNENVLIGPAWQATINSLNETNALARAIKPIEGTTGWTNNWMISNSTKSINCAYKWIDWAINPQTNAQIAEWFGEAPANKNSCTLMADKNHCTKFNAQDLDFWKDIYYWRYPTTKCLDGRTEIECVSYENWFLTWTNFRNS